MAETKIEWADFTFNAWVGCSKVSPACDHCYAEGWAKRTGQAGLWAGERRRTSAANWRQPIKWDTAAAIAGERKRVFCASLADVFDNQAEPEWRRDLFRLIEVTPNLDWLLLTKRPQNIAKMLPFDWGDGYPNVWLGTTVENQLEAARRIPFLIHTPAAKHFLSCEPLLGPVDLSEWLFCPTSLDHAPTMDPTTGAYECCSKCDYTGIRQDIAAIDWVIAGGESGPGARPMHPSWPISLRDQCTASGGSFFFKQWGEWKPLENPGDGFWPTDEKSFIRLDAAGDRTAEGRPFQKIGKKLAGRELEGRLYDEIPA